MEEAKVNSKLLFENNKKWSLARPEYQFKDNM
jgi:hypothetical protein